MTGCVFCYQYPDKGLNEVHEKCQYCPHRRCEKYMTVGCPCICHFGRTYLTFGEPKR